MLRPPRPSKRHQIFGLPTGDQIEVTAERTAAVLFDRHNAGGRFEHNVVKLITTVLLNVCHDDRHLMMLHRISIPKNEGVLNNFSSDDTIFLETQVLSTVFSIFFQSNRR